jgi:hypothetical protein
MNMTEYSSVTLIQVILKYSEGGKWRDIILLQNKLTYLVLTRQSHRLNAEVIHHDLDFS